MDLFLWDSQTFKWRLLKIALVDEGFAGQKDPSISLQNRSKLRHWMGKAREKVSLEKDHHAAFTF